MSAVYRSTKQSRRGKIERGFTLIEVLVVVAIVALLVSILLPALTRAREQTRQVTCLSRLHQILAATGMYMSQNRDWYPLGPAETIEDHEFDGITYRMVMGNCLWGGRQASHHYPEIKWYQRPLSRLLWRGTPNEDQASLFECPSDKGSIYYPETKGRTIYEMCGNSFYMNVHGENPRFGIRPRAPLSSIVLYEEGNMAFLLGNPPTLPYVYSRNPHRDKGWHGQENRFNLGFLDLHAAYTYVDTLELGGPGWNVRDFFRIWAWLEN